jgi:hypothetical protein
MELANEVVSELNKSKVEEGEDENMYPATPVVEDTYFDLLNKCKDEDEVRSLKNFVSNVLLSVEGGERLEKRISDLKSELDESEGKVSKVLQKKAVKRDLYRVARLCNFDKVCSQFAITPTQLLENVEGVRGESVSHSSKHKVEDPDKSLETYAFEYICSEFGTEERVIMAFKMVMVRCLCFIHYIIRMWCIHALLLCVRCNDSLIIDFISISFIIKGQGHCFRTSYQQMVNERCHAES